MPLKSRLTSPQREARTAGDEGATAAPVAEPTVEPTTSPRRRGYDTPAPQPEPPVETAAVEQEFVAGGGDPTDVDEQTEAPEPGPSPEAPKRRGPKPGTKRAPRRIALPVTGTGESLDIGAAKQRQKEIEGEAASLLQQYQKNLAELESEHRELAIQISAATFGH